MGNAETPKEAVQYAIAKESLISQQYLVYDSFDLAHWLMFYKDGIITDSAEVQSQDPPS